MYLFKFPRASRVAVVALLALTVPLAGGEEKANPEGARPAQVDPYVITIDFPGGPMSTLIASLKTGKESNFTVIQSANLDPMLPSFSVRNARFEWVVAALGRILDPQGYDLVPVGPGVAALTQRAPARAQAFASFQLESKLGTRSIDEITAAIQSACDFADPGDPGHPDSRLRFKYHPATKMLFVAGTHQQVEVAHEVIGSLPEPVKTPAPPSGKQ